MNARTKRILKKATLCLLSATILCHAFNKMKITNHHPQINTEYDGTNYFASYSEGKIYICQEQDKKSFLSLKEGNDVVVVDKRDGLDPDMIIIDSYSIYDTFNMKEILEALMEYERIDPSEWDRTYESMRNEWICHNVSYLCNYKREHTDDVDLNNADEELYREINIPKLIKSQDTYSK